MSALGEQLDSYLALRRAVGYKLVEHARLLPGFIAESSSYVMSKSSRFEPPPCGGAATSQAAAARRLSLVRGFASYLSAFDPATEVPPARPPPGGPGRRPPYLYSSREIGALMTAARSLYPQLWGASMATLIGLGSPRRGFVLARPTVSEGATSISIAKSSPC